MKIVLLFIYSIYMIKAQQLLGGYGDFHDPSGKENQLYEQAVRQMTENGVSLEGDEIKFHPLLQNPQSKQVKTQVVAGLNYCFRVNS
ncbi:hypothetical protein MXB_3075, partial [Myxobolus squamalis]